MRRTGEATGRKPGDGDGVPSRRLAAIMFTDIVGFSALVHRNENLALRLVEQQRSIVREQLPRFAGREVEVIGDAFLIEFASALAAVECAVAIQRALAAAGRGQPDDARVVLRAGIHIGDIQPTGKGVFGDSVNIAARLQALAPPGGIAISDAVYGQVQHKVELHFEAQGPIELKNISEPVEVLFLRPDALDVARPKAAPARHVRLGPMLVAAGLAAGVLLALVLQVVGYAPRAIDRAQATSVAVLPFANMSADPDNEFFADGMHDTLLTHLAHVRDLKVISRTSVMEYKGATRNIRDIAAALHASHIVEGSVQRVGSRVRVTAQLIEAATDRHLWAESYDRDVADTFAIQSDLAQKIASSVHVALSAGEKALFENRPTGSPEAYELYLEAAGIEQRDRFTAKSQDEAIERLEQAVALDPKFSLAQAALARMHVFKFHMGTDPSPQRLAAAAAAADTALRLAPDSPEAHLARGLYLYYGISDLPAALTELDRVLKAQPNSAAGHQFRGYVLRRLGRGEEAVVNLARAVGLDPRNAPEMNGLASTYAVLHRYTDALRICRELVETNPDRQEFRKVCGTYGMRIAGDLSEMRAARDYYRATNDAKNLPAVELDLALYENRLAELPALIRAVPEEEMEPFGTPRELQLADAYRWLGQAAAAREQYRKARSVLDQRLEALDTAYPNKRLLGETHLSLAIVHAELGDAATARREMELGLKLVPEAEDTMIARSMAASAAYVTLRLGDPAGALAQLDRLLSVQSYANIHELRLSPYWAELRKHPGFQALVDKYAPRG